MRFVQGERGANFVRDAHGVWRQPMTRTAATVPSIGTSSISSLEPTIVQMAPRLYSPLYQESNLMLPKDRVTVNAWCLHFTETDHWVSNAINLHTYYPLGGFGLACPHAVPLQLYEDMAEEMSLFENVLGVGKDWWVFGEAFPFLEWDPSKGWWSHAMEYNPDYIDVSTHPMAKEPILFLKPDERPARRAASSDSCGLRDARREHTAFAEEHHAHS